MKRKEKPGLVIPDSRGRILLPPSLRSIPLFELLPLENGAWNLQPLETKKTQPPSRPKWYRSEVQSYLKKSVYPNLQEWGESKPEIIAIALYGSRKNGTDLQSSDFDFAIFFEKKISRQQWLTLESSLEDTLSDNLQDLKSHGITGEWSFVPIFPIEENATPPAIYFTIATEGDAVFERENKFKLWNEKIQKLIKRIGAKKVRQGSKESWQWNTSKIS